MESLGSHRALLLTSHGALGKMLTPISIFSRNEDAGCLRALCQLDGLLEWLAYETEFTSLTFHEEGPQRPHLENEGNVPTLLGCSEN